MTTGASTQARRPRDAEALAATRQLHALHPGSVGSEREAMLAAATVTLQARSSMQSLLEILLLGARIRPEVLVRGKLRGVYKDA